MIMQLQASVLCDLMALESGDQPHLDSLRDALILAKETALTPPAADTVVNDRTALPFQTLPEPKT